VVLKNIIKTMTLNKKTLHFL